MPPHTHLSHDEFFTQLSSLFTSRHQKSTGSIWLTQKRLTHDPSNPPQKDTSTTHDDLSDLHPSTPLPLIIHATDGNGSSPRSSSSAPGAAAKKKKDKKIKLSTIVQPDEIDAFYARYADVCKSGMQGLRKRDRKARKKGGKKGKGAGAGAGEEAKKV